MLCIVILLWSCIVSYIEELAYESLCDFCTMERMKMSNLVLNWNISHVKANDCPVKFTYLTIYICVKLSSHVLFYMCMKLVVCM